MRANIFILTLFMVAFVQCGGDKDQLKEQSSESTQTATLPHAGVESQPCDFSSFKPKLLRALGGIGAPAISKPQPAYPQEAKARGLEGMVKIKVLINTRGEVEQACVAEGDDVLGEAAKRAALQSRFGSYWGNQLIKEGYSHGEGIMIYRFTSR
jgi:TonB family protein